MKKSLCLLKINSLFKTNSLKLKLISFDFASYKSFLERNKIEKLAILLRQELVNAKRIKLLLFSLDIK